MSLLIIGDNKMLHEVKSKRDIILDGQIYRVDKNGFVELPRKHETYDCKPVKENKNPDDESENEKPPVDLTPEEIEKENAKKKWIDENGSIKGFLTYWRKEHKDSSEEE
jgi:hypothetical protein